MNFAYECRAKQLILDHFSQRYKKQSEIDPNDKKSAEVTTDKILLEEGYARARELGKSEGTGFYIAISSVFRKITGL